MSACHNVFNVRPKTTVLPVWTRDAKRLDTPAIGQLQVTEEKALYDIKCELGKPQMHPSQIQFQPHLWGCLLGVNQQLS